MSGVSSFVAKLVLLFRRNRFRNELDEEMAFHRVEAEKEFRARGMSGDEARTAAARRFGNATRLREQSHEEVGFSAETVLQDIRFALRQLRQNPGFAATASVVLALGIASSVAIFAFVDAALIQPLPYKDPSRLAVLFESVPLGPRFHLSWLDYVDWKRENKVFTSMDVFTEQGMNLRTGDGLRQVHAARVSDGFFRTLGVTPALGRDFYTNEVNMPTGRTALLTYSTWQNRYGSRPDVLGRSLELDDLTYTVVGVLPRDFSFAPAEPAEYWVLENPSRGCDRNRGCHNLLGVARLKDGVSFESALANIKTIAQKLEKQYPDSNTDQWAFLMPLSEVVVGDTRPILLVLLSGAGLLLLIAGMNVSSLVLVRAQNRQQEIAVRGALGASTGRLVLQFLIEGMVLAIIGGALGMSGAQQGMRVLCGLIPKDMIASMPYLRTLGLSVRVAAFGCLLTVLCGALFAAIPLGSVRFQEIRDGLSKGTRTTAGMLWRRFGTKLVVVELASAMVLLAGAGLLCKSFYRMLRTDIGLTSEHLAVLSVSGSQSKFNTDAKEVALGREVLQKVRSLPGVTSVGLTSKLSIEDGDETSDFEVVGRTDKNMRKEAAYRAVSANYLPTLKARLLEGRFFTDDEDAAKPRVMIINRTMMRQYFPGQDPVGLRISLGPKEPLYQIVGVVSDLQEGQLDAQPRAAMYISFNQYPMSDFALAIRSSQGGEALLATLQNSLRQVDRDLAVHGAESMEQKIHDAPSTYLHRSSAWLVGGFAAIALLLGVVGLYGVIAYSVSQRTREIGVRMALGAARSTVYRLVLREAGRLIAVGVLCGLGASFGATLLMRKLLFGVSAWDAPTLAGVGCLLAICALIGSYLPARRAASVNPAAALRAE